jgi:hypothetical protein
MIKFNTYVKLFFAASDSWFKVPVFRNNNNDSSNNKNKDNNNKVREE